MKTPEFLYNFTLSNEFEKLSNIQKEIIITWTASQTPLLISETGMGKSSTIRSLAQKLNFSFYYINTPYIDESSLGMMPALDKNYKPPVFWDAVPAWIFELEREVNEGKYNGAIIFFDEVNRAKKQVMNGVMTIISDRRFATYSVSENILFVAAMNPYNNLYNTESLDIAALRRFVVLFFEQTFEEWCKVYANNNIEEVLLKFIEINKAERYYKLIAGLTMEKTVIISPATWDKCSKVFTTWFKIYFNIKTEKNNVFKNFLLENLKNKNIFDVKESIRNFLNNDVTQKLLTSILGFQLYKDLVIFIDEIYIHSLTKGIQELVDKIFDVNEIINLIDEIDDQLKSISLFLTSYNAIEKEMLSKQTHLSQQVYIIKEIFNSLKSLKTSNKQASTEQLSTDLFSNTLIEQLFVLNINNNKFLILTENLINIYKHKINSDEDKITDEQKESYFENINNYRLFFNRILVYFNIDKVEKLNLKPLETYQFNELIKNKEFSELIELLYKFNSKFKSFTKINFNEKNIAQSVINFINPSIKIK